MWAEGMPSGGTTSLDGRRFPRQRENVLHRCCQLNNYDTRLPRKLTLRQFIYFLLCCEERWKLAGKDEDGFAFTVVVTPIAPDILVVTVIT